MSDDALEAELARAGRDLARARGQVVRDIQSLRRQVAQTTDWREWVRRRPGAALGVAFALGCVVGLRR